MSAGTDDEIAAIVSPASRYRRSAAVVDAVQLTGTNIEAVGDWVSQGGGSCGGVLNGPKAHLRLDTPAGPQYCIPGWWVVRGVEGDFCGVEPSIFAATFNPEPPP